MIKDVPLMKDVLPATDTLPVVETFHSVQGEGIWAGSNAFFIRLAGCDVGCPWCDTKHSWPAKHHPKRAVEELVAEAIAHNPNIIIITGGEPLMHSLATLTAALRKANLKIHLETSGSHPLSGTFDWISLSPKPFKPPLDNIYSRASELKVIISDFQDLDWATVQGQKVSAKTVKLLQPEWDSKVGAQLAFDYVLSHPEWRLSLQTHKLLGVR